jgi:hypothetical protein
LRFVLGGGAAGSSKRKKYGDSPLAHRGKQHGRNRFRSDKRKMHGAADCCSESAPSPLRVRVPDSKCGGADNRCSSVEQRAGRAGAGHSPFSAYHHAR